MKAVDDYNILGYTGPGHSLPANLWVVKKSIKVGTLYNYVFTTLISVTAHERKPLFKKEILDLGA